MKSKIKYVVTILMITILSACGPAPTPTMSPADVQGTAVAAAWTVVALTQEAIPTATPIPPTETPSPTPLPTFTPLPQPTVEFPTQSAFGAPANPPAGGPTADPCNAPISKDAAGHKIKVDLYNKSSGTATLSLYLSKTEFGECGIYSFVLDKGHHTVDLLEGCYWAGAFITGPKHTSKAFGPFCITDPSHKWTVTIKDEVIGFYD